MAYLKSFSELGKNDAPIAGGKGASLGEMTQAGIPVPPGFVILADAFEHFITETDLVQEIEAILGTVNHNEIHTVEKASESIQALILSREMPADIQAEISASFAELNTEYVAVRSSATAEDGTDHAWAGQLESYLNTTEKELLPKVKHCWASLFTPRAIFYRFEKGLHTHKISVAVVVQKMVASEISGIAFSVHPVTEDRNQLIIEAGYGLGEAIVSGQITPDSYVVEKTPRKILDVNVATQTRGLYRIEGGGSEWQTILEPKASLQVMSEQQILEFSELILKIENHYGFPCDIEWAYEAGEFYIVQSRPITTLGSISQRKLIYTKTLERDTTLLMVGTFTEVMTDDLKRTFGIDVFKGPSYFFETNENNIVFYENLEAVNRLIAEIAARSSDDVFLDKVEHIYKEYRPKTLMFWNKGKADNIEEYATCLKTSRPYMLVVAIAFYGGLAESLPKRAADLYLRIRSETDFFATGDAYSRNTFEALGVERNLVNLITQDELLNVPTNEELKRRKKQGSVLQMQIHHVYEHGETISDIFPDYEFREEKATEGASNVTGQSVAERGIVRGRIRIIRNKDDSANTVEGEIIVASMTTPDFLPAMMKATAFVTDEGGITCHAAIVAREMKKPCVIGTKFATQVLKDGDLVEVDADNGVVRIIEKASPFGAIDSWQRLFRVQGLRFLITDIWMEHYRVFGTLVLYSNDEFISFLPQIQYEKLLKEGKEFMQDGNAFSVYESAFRTYIKQATLLKDVVGKEELTVTLTEEIFKSLSGFYTFYYKTEFFYTDMAYAYSRSVDDKQLNDNLQRIGVLKNEGRECMNALFFGGEAIFMQLLLQLKEKFGIEVTDLLQYSQAEILTLFKGERVSQEHLNARNQAFYFLGKGQSVEKEEGSGAKELIAHFLAGKEGNTEKIIKGIVANQGQGKTKSIVGTARIFKMGFDIYHSLSSSIEAMQKGDILVAETTSPEYMQACMKASAIITDQGGMLSHAAIVSRELGISCIVGTGNATELIADGDTVEVDASTGTIRIIEKA